MPKCTMIAPAEGIYQADLKELWSEKSSKVWVEVHNNHVNKNLTKAIDIAATAVNVGCIGVGIAAAFNPITAPIVIASKFLK